MFHPCESFNRLPWCNPYWHLRQIAFPAQGFSWCEMTELSRGTSLERIAFGSNVDGIACDRGVERRPSFQAGYGRSDPGERRRLTTPGSPRPLGLRPGALAMTRNGLPELAEGDARARTDCAASWSDALSDGIAVGSVVIPAQRRASKPL
jgi:hypothetical protein